MDEIKELAEGTILKNSEPENKVKVFVCGGGSPVTYEYYNDAYKIGEMLANLDTAYGQGGLSDRKTMMGESYHGYIDAGGDSAYFISRSFGIEDILKDFDNLKGVVEIPDISMLLKAQYIWSDVVVVTPGGTGTLIELLGYIELTYDYLDKKPTVIVYNKQVDNKGFFDDILTQISKSRKIGFVSSPVIENNFILVNNLDDLYKTLSLKVQEEKDKKRNSK